MVSRFGVSRQVRWSAFRARLLAGLVPSACPSCAAVACLPVRGGRSLWLQCLWCGWWGSRGPGPSLPLSGAPVQLGFAL